jgi:hypothetical protein
MKGVDWSRTCARVHNRAQPSWLSVFFADATNSWYRTKHVWSVGGKFAKGEIVDIVVVTELCKIYNQHIQTLTKILSKRFFLLLNHRCVAWMAFSVMITSENIIRYDFLQFYKWHREIKRYFISLKLLTKKIWPSSLPSFTPPCHSRLPPDDGPTCPYMYLPWGSLHNRAHPSWLGGFCPCPKNGLIAWGKVVSGKL